MITNCNFILHFVLRHSIKLKGLKEEGDEILFYTLVSILSSNLLLFTNDGFIAADNSSFEINPRSISRLYAYVTRGPRLFLVIRSFNENQKYHALA